MNNNNAASQGETAIRNDIATKRFQTILVARPNTTRPSGKSHFPSTSIEIQYQRYVGLCFILLSSELEIQLRDYCEKVRVHTQLSGAHIIVPCGTSLAVRAYYPHDLERIHADALDDLPVFLEHFQTIVVFFIMPFAAQQAVMGDRNSFVRRAFDLIDTWQDPKNEHHKNPPRMAMVNDTRDAVFYLMQMVDAMRPEKTKLRQEYFLRKQKQHLCLLPQVPDKNVLSDHIGNAVMEWGKLWDISADDIRLVFMSVKTIGSLATMDEETMAKIPVDKGILLRLRNFFAGKRVNEYQVAGTKEAFDTNSHTMFEQHRESAIDQQTFPAPVVSPHDLPTYMIGNGQSDYATAMNATRNGSMDASMAVHPPSRTPQRYDTQCYSYPPYQALHPQSRCSQPYVEHMRHPPYQVNVPPPYGRPPSHHTFVPQSPWMQPSNEFPYRGPSTPYQYPHHDEHFYHPSGSFQTPSQSQPQHPRNFSAPWGSSVSSRGRPAHSLRPTGYGPPNIRNGPR